MPVTRSTTSSAARAARRGLLAFALIVASGGAAASAQVPREQPYRPTGQRVTGGDDPASATALTPGSYVDSLADAGSASERGSSRYYVVTGRPGDTVHLAATVAPPATATDPASVDGSLGVSLTVTPRGEDSSCADDGDSDIGYDDRLGAVTATLTLALPTRSAGTGSVTPTPTSTPGADVDDDCPIGALVVRVSRTGAAFAGDPLGVELVLRTEPPVGGDGLPAAATTAAPQLRPDLTGPPATLRSGDSYVTAPLLADGIYRDRVGAGDTRVVRVRLGWGQRLSYLVTTAARAGVDPADDISMQAGLRNPVRAVAAQGPESSSQDFGVGSDDGQLSGYSYAPVRYENRRSADSQIAAYSLAGDYYLVLTSNVPDSGSTTVSYPYTLQIRVSGREQPGPSYAAPPDSGVADRAPAAGRGRALALAVELAVAGVALAVLVALLVRRGRSRRPGQRRQT